MSVPTRRRRLTALFIAVAGLLAVPGVAAAAPHAAPTAASAWHGERPPGYYLALGDSLAAGYQPSTGDDKDGGYVGVVQSVLRHTWRGTELVNLACSGETVVSMVEGGRCDYPEGNQLDAATAFLSTHARATRVITIDIGANDVQRCVGAAGVDLPCITGGMNAVATRLPGVLAALHERAPKARVVVLNYYNPFLAATLQGPAGEALAAESTQLQSTLNGIIEGAARANGAMVADIARSFQSTSTRPTRLPGVGTVPRNVALICSWTWMCERSDIHANDTGYAVMGVTVLGRLWR